MRRLTSLRLVSPPKRSVTSSTSRTGRRWPAPSGARAAVGRHWVAPGVVPRPSAPPTPASDSAISRARRLRGDDPLRPEDHHDDDEGAEVDEAVGRVDVVAQHVRQPLQDEGAEDDARDRAHAAEDDHRQHEQRGHQQEVVGREEADLAGVEHAGRGPRSRRRSRRRAACSAPSARRRRPPRPRPRGSRSRTGRRGCPRAGLKAMTTSDDEAEDEVVVGQRGEAPGVVERAEVDDERRDRRAAGAVGDVVPAMLSPLTARMRTISPKPSVTMAR